MSLTSNISASIWPLSKVRTVLKSSNNQISKVTLLFEFGQVEAEILLKNKLMSFFVDMVYYGFVLQCFIYHIIILQQYCVVVFADSQLHLLLAACQCWQEATSNN